MNKETGNTKLIIVPDVHGREFWIDAHLYDCDIVFLGDYLDPYPQEFISKEEALDNFMHILGFANGRDNVHLLLGNHDLCYILGRKICDDRCDDKNYKQIRKLFKANENRFDLAYNYSVAGKQFFISHAGITHNWYMQHRDIFSGSYQQTLDADLINSLYHTRQLDGILGEVGYARGGNKHGSIVWADFSEHWDGKQHVGENLKIQIFGHTHYRKPVDFTKLVPIYDADACCCTQINDRGEVSPILMQ